MLTWISTSPLVVLSPCLNGARERVSASSRYLPGIYTKSKSYLCNFIISLWIIGVISFRVFPTIAISGRWSVSGVKVGRPYTQLWNFSSPKTNPKHSFSIWKDTYASSMLKLSHSLFSLTNKTAFNQSYMNLKGNVITTWNYNLRFEKLTRETAKMLKIEISPLSARVALLTHIITPHFTVILVAIKSIFCHKVCHLNLLPTLCVSFRRPLLVLHWYFTELCETAMNYLAATCVYVAARISVWVCYINQSFLGMLISTVNNSWKLC